MGGTVQLGIRTSDGKSRGVESYTSAISSFFDNDRFIEDDIFHVREFFIDHSDPDMRLIIPNGYGLVFGDHVTKKLHSMQCYTAPMSISSTSLSLSLSGAVITGGTATEQENYIDHVRFERLFRKGYIRHYAMWATGGGYDLVDVDPELTCDQLFKNLIDEYRNKKMPVIGEYIINSGFRIINYQETPAGYTQFRDNLIADGIRLSDKELSLWEEAIEDRTEYYEEDGETWDDDPYEPSRFDSFVMAN